MLPPSPTALGIKMSIPVLMPSLADLAVPTSARTTSYKNVAAFLYICTVGIRIQKRQISYDQTCSFEQRFHYSVLCFKTSELGAALPY